MEIFRVGKEICIIGQKYSYCYLLWQQTQTQLMMFGSSNVNAAAQLTMPNILVLDKSTLMPTLGFNLNIGWQYRKWKYSDFGRKYTL